MITKFKLYENYNKPRDNDDDYQFKWWNGYVEWICGI